MLAFSPALCFAGVMADVIEIDGSQGEGGGQVLRSSLALALLTGRPFHLRNVRARRSKPGLQPQHLKSVQAAAEIGQARLHGASLGSCDLSFEPGPVRAGSYRFDIGTAGATGLVLHTIYLPLALRGEGPSEVTLTGGTHVTHSPSFHFLDATWRPHIAALGLNVSLRLDRPGFYPRGGGVVRAFLQPCRAVQPLTLTERGEVTIMGTSAVAGLDRGIAARQSRRARQLLERADLEATIREESWDGGPGSVLVLRAEAGGVPATFVGLGARGKPAEVVAEEAVAELLAFVQAGQGAVDPHSADQLVLPLAFAAGASEYTTSDITLHLTTNIGIIRRFIERDIVIEGAEGQPGRVLIR